VVKEAIVDVQLYRPVGRCIFIGYVFGLAHFYAHISFEGLAQLHYASRVFLYILMKVYIDQLLVPFVLLFD
jgi:hypothetical protein